MTREEFYKLTDILNTEVLGNFMHGGEADELIAMFEETVEHSNILEQEEPVSEDLEEAINAYIGYAPEVDECSSVYGKRQAFKAGAEWQKSQGVTEEAVIGITPKEYFISISQSTVDELDLCAGDKVIVQLRKKEDKI